MPPSSAEPEVGPKYWRSLDQLADTPAFQKWLENEFPAGASEFNDPVSRRHFVKIMSASFLLMGLGVTGCRRPVHKILPYSQMPDNYEHGVAQYYATSMPTRGSAVPLLARSNDGRPTKLEGNKQHPIGNGGTDAFAQASLLNLYDPDRTFQFEQQGEPASAQAALNELDRIAKQAQSNQGKGLHFLMEQSSSPSRARLRQQLQKKYPQAGWHVYEPVDFTIHQQAASLACGQPVTPQYRFDKAKVIVSLDCDFIGTEEEAHVNINRFTQGRKLEQPTDSMNRLYAVEGLFTLTGMNADHRLRVPTSGVFQVAADLAAHVLAETGISTDQVGEVLTSAVRQGRADVDPRWVQECANDLLQHPGEVLVVAGHRQPLAVHLMAHAMNAALGSIGQTVVYQEAGEPEVEGIDTLAEALEAGQVSNLVILGGNPVYNAPVELDWKTLQRRAQNIVRLGYYNDETAEVCNWHLPMAHFLEAWGDARTGDGTVVSVQPLIAPLFGGLTELEVLARIGGLQTTDPHDIVRQTILELTGGGEEQWRKLLHDGFLADSAAPSKDVELNWQTIATSIQEAARLPQPEANQLEVVFCRDASMDDGRFNNNGWMQELPDPVTKMTWENVILLSPQTARDLGVDFTDEEDSRIWVPQVSVTLEGREITGPLWIQPGLADNTVALALGYGREQTGRVGVGAGYNAYRLRTGSAPYIASGAQLARTGETMTLACTQQHWAMESRPVIREANLEDYREKPDFADAMSLPSPSTEYQLYPNPLDQLKQSEIHQWGMSIDLTACVGCSACVIACQSENNVPIVGKPQVEKSREMHWLRIDRYYTGSPEDPQAVTQPMLCQHCESAPCESVCPVNATVHDTEGLNLMVYNRCVGTRYCSNNCPYKVRRFNFFDYNRRPLDELYKTPIFMQTDGQWELARWFKQPAKGSLPEDQWELSQLIKNPDVTVRMRGVMEKCTFCVQRIEQAKIAQKVDARDSGDVEVPDGTIETACQQACPADAIVFGNVKDPNSRVSKLKAQQRDYSVLEYLGTKPRTTYLARLRNPNPAMPDPYKEMPGSMKEFTEEHANPFETHGHGHGGGDAHGAAATGEGNSNEKGGH